LATSSRDEVEILLEYERVMFFETEEILSERRGEVQDQDRSLLPYAASAVLRHTWTSRTILAFHQTVYTAKSDISTASTTPIILSKMSEEAAANTISTHERDDIVSSSPASTPSSSPGVRVAPNRLGGDEAEKTSEFSDETTSRIARFESVSLGHDP
jgi:hypothetical protein